MTRQLFSINTGGTVVSDTGGNVTGAIEQVSWQNDGGDTGGTVELSLLAAEGDTGAIIPLFTLGLTQAGWIKAPRLLATHPDGFDTGRTIPVPAVAHGERLRLKVTPGGTGVAGRLWCWVRDDG